MLHILKLTVSGRDERITHENDSGNQNFFEKVNAFLN